MRPVHAIFIVIGVALVIIACVSVFEVKTQHPQAIVKEKPKVVTPPQPNYTFVTCPNPKCRLHTVDGVSSTSGAQFEIEDMVYNGYTQGYTYVCDYCGAKWYVPLTKEERKKRDGYA